MGDLLSAWCMVCLMEKLLKKSFFWGAACMSAGNGSGAGGALVVAGQRVR